MTPTTEKIPITSEEAEYFRSKTSDEQAKLLAEGNACFWAAYHKLKLQSGPFSLKGREYLAEWIHGPADKKRRAKKRCAMKAPQDGFSIGEAIDNLHGMITGRYPQGVLHLLPTKATVEEFGKAKYGPLISKNRAAIGKYIKTGAKGSDSASLKQIGDSYLYLRSATLSADGAGDGKTSAPLSSISVDKVDFDEIELMDAEAIALAIGRMGASEVHEEVYIANPLGEDSGIDLIYKQSDMRHWHRKCSCVGGVLSAWTCAEQEFPNCVKEYPDADEREREGKHRGYIACKKCGKPLPIWAGPGTGMWIPDRPSVIDFEGYQKGHLTSNFHDPITILKEFEDPPYGNLGGVYRMRLGEPFSSAEDKLRENVVLANCGNHIMPTKHTGPCAAGLDVGLVKHIIIGTRLDKERYDVVRVAQIKSFEDAYDMCIKYGVKQGVVDIRPYEDEARAFQKKCMSKGITIFLCQYVDSPVQEQAFNDNTGVVKTYRTGIFDRSHRVLSNGLIILSRQDSAMKEFAQQCCNCEKYPTQDRLGATVMRYRVCGNIRQGDHYRNTLNYFLLAAGRTPTVKKKGFTRQTVCINE